LAASTVGPADFDEYDVVDVEVVDVEADGVEAAAGDCAITRADGDVIAMTKMAVAEMILRFKSTLLLTSGL
jgi:hypothetical protein